MAYQFEISVGPSLQTRVRGGISHDMATVLPLQLSDERKRKQTTNKQEGIRLSSNCSTWGPNRDPGINHRGRASCHQVHNQLEKPGKRHQRMLENVRKYRSGLGILCARV